MQCLCFLTTVVLCARGSTIDPAAEEGAVTINEGARPNIADWHDNGHVDASASVPLTMALVHRNLDTLNDLFWRVSDPDSSEYAQYLSDEKIADQFGPTVDEVRGLENLLRGQYHASHVSTTPLRDFLQISLPASQAERLLGVSLCRWTSPAGEIVRACKASTTAYSLPRNVTHIVAFVEGLIAFPTPSRKQPKPSEGTPVSTPASLKTVYGVQENMTVMGDTKQVVFGAAGQFVSPSDLSDFFAHVYPQAKEHGNISFVGPNRPDHPGGEAMLDVEYIMAMGRGAPTVFFYDMLLWGSLLSYVSHQNPPPSVVSISYGQMEYQIPAFMAKSTSANFQKQALRGVTFTVASGDDGVGCHQTILGKEKFAPTFPGGSPYILSIGGTKLDQRANWTHQVAAQFSGGGFSFEFSRPSFQDDAVAKYLGNSSMRYPDQQYWNRNGRGMPDVSLVGDNVQIWINGASQNTGGTSATAPQVGGLITVLNDARASKGLPPLGFVAPLLYKLARDHPDTFIDIDEGNNYAPCNMVTPCPCNNGQGSPTHAGFVAAKGWDPVTGLGAFNFPRLLEYVLQAGTGMPKSLGNSNRAARDHPCIVDTSPGLHKGVKCDAVRIPAAWGHTIGVTYNVPKQCLTSQCGIIVDVHGGAMDAEQQNMNTNMRSLGKQHNYIVVQPIAPPGLVPVNNWGWGPPVTDASDTAVFNWLQQALNVSDWKIDRQRIHFMGFSEGGHMTWRMLLKHADVFASMVVIEAVEPSAGFFPTGMAEIPVLAQGGKFDVPEPYAQHIATWKNLRQVWSTDAGTHIAGDESFNRTRYISKRGTVFETIEHGYVADYSLLGHCFPGSNDTHIINPHEIPFVGPFGCPGQLSQHKASFFIGDEAMRFFLAHPKAGPSASAVLLV